MGMRYPDEQEATEHEKELARIERNTDETLTNEEKTIAVLADIAESLAGIRENIAYSNFFLSRIAKHFEKQTPK